VDSVINENITEIICLPQCNRMQLFLYQSLAGPQLIDNQKSVTHSTQDNQARRRALTCKFNT